MNKKTNIRFPFVFIITVSIILPLNFQIIFAQTEHEKFAVDIYKRRVNQNASDDQLLDLLRSTWNKRDDRYSELRTHEPSSEKFHPKVEMFQIGG